MIAPDTPAHGFSDAPADIKARSLTRGLFEALDQVLDEPAVLFGNSMGGFAAIRYALERPERVLGLVLCSPSGAAMASNELEALRDTFRIDSKAKALQFVDRLFASPAKHRRLIAWGVRRSMAQRNIRALLQTVEPNDLLEPAQLRALKVPILLLWGQAERILPDSSFEFFRAHLPSHALLERPEQFGHSPYLEHPGRVTRRILAFMADLEPRDHPLGS